MNTTIPERSRRGPFKTSVDMPAVQLSPEAPRSRLHRELTRVTMNAETTSALITSALADFGIDDVPEERDLLELLVRGYVVPRLVGHGSMSAIARMLERLLPSHHT